MADYQEAIAKIRTARKTRDDARTELHASLIQGLVLDRRIARAERGDIDRRDQNGGNDRPPRPGRHDDERERVNGRKREAGQKFATARDDLAGLIGELFADRDPQSLIEAWPANHPILLLPLRVETRFRETELLVRIFPDDIAVQTHEAMLTDREYPDGVAYWTALANAASEELRKVTWRKLTDAFGTDRAAWIALATKPANWDDLATVGVDGLTFVPPAQTKPDSWSEAPHVRVLPDRLVLMLFRGGAVVHTAVGNQIEDLLAAGPAPLVEPGDKLLSHDANNRVTFDSAFRWLADFNEALSKGLAFRVPLGPADSGGYDELVIVGLKHSADASDGKDLLEQLIDAQHYSKNGFALVPQGTPTRNTSRTDSGFDGRDWFSDASYLVSAGKPLFDEVTDLDKAADGQRLAVYLGIEPSILYNVPNAGRFDHREAVAMNAALFPGTIGYFLRTLIPEAVSEPTLERIRDFFIRFVSGRGPLAAVKVGRQPYGIVLASTCLTREETMARREEPDFIAGTEHCIATLRKIWRGFLNTIPFVGRTTDASAELMGVLGLQPTSAEFFQRVAYSYDSLRNLASFQSGGANMDNVFAMIFEGFAADRFLSQLGYQIRRADGTQKPYPLLFQLIYREYQTRLDAKNLIDVEPWSEETGIKPYHPAAGLNYIDWLRTNAGDAEKLRAQDFAGAPRPTSLLYMMLRHSLLIEASNSLFKLLSSQNIQARELVSSRKFLGITSTIDISPWEVMAAPVSSILTGIADDAPLLTYVRRPQFLVGDVAHIGAPLQGVIDSLDVLRTLPTARLERLLAEHLDTLSFRLDAWQTGIFDQRLRTLRSGSQQQQPQRGIYLGAVGYLENVRPSKDRRIKLNETEFLPAELREGRDNLFATPKGGGYVHAPSLNHAAAAAILRNGYLTHATPDEPDLLAVNLSSRRVRRAKQLLDGIRNGQSLEVLLGIQFERGLHEWTTKPTGAVTLNQLKPVLRKAFPIKRSRIPHAGIEGAEPEIVPDYSVINGVDIANSADTFPTGVADLPALSLQQVDALKAERLAVKDALDGLKDTVTAESAYQLALGNFDRAAAIVQAVSGAYLPPEIEITRSSRGTDIAFIQRFVIQFDATQTANPWPSIAMTPRAKLEAPLNHWIGGMVGDPEKIRCSLAALDKQGNVLLDTGGNPIEGVVSLADLVLQPLDLIAILRGSPEPQSFSELESRVRAAFAGPRMLADNILVRISFADSGSPSLSIRSFAEILQLLEAARRIIVEAKPMTGRDSLTTSKPSKTDDLDLVDLVELQSRLATLRTALDNAFSDLAIKLTAATAAGSTAADIDGLRDALTTVSNAGIERAFPQSGFGDAQPARSILTAQAQWLVTRFTAMTKDYDDALSKLSDPAVKSAQKLEFLTAMAQSFYGPDFRLLPRFTFPNLAEVSAAYATRDALLTYAKTTKNIPDPVGEVVHSLGHVRLPMHRFRMLSLLQETVSEVALPLSVIQLPYRANDTWLGTEFKVGTSIFHDTLSLIQCLPQGFSPGSAQCGLRIDEWIESFPKRREMTGISFHYDQPNSMPLQSLLLAIPPAGRRHWTWDDLVRIIRDTIESAKLRAVEPDMIDKVEGLTTLLPATMAEFNTTEGAISLDYSLNVKYVIDQAIARGFATTLIAK
jgi:hypothetical protein